MEPEAINALYSTYGLWGTVILLVIFLVAQIIRDIIKARKERSKALSAQQLQAEIFNQLSLQSETNYKILQYLKIVINKYSEDVTLSQARTIIKMVIAVAKFEKLEYTNKIMTYENIQSTKKEIRAKIDLFFRNMHQKNILTLAEFKYNGNNLDYVIADAKIDDVISEVQNIVVEEKGIETLRSYFNNKFLELETMMLGKI